MNAIWIAVLCGKVRPFYFGIGLCKVSIPLPIQSFTSTNREGGGEKKKCGNVRKEQCGRRRRRSLWPFFRRLDFHFPTHFSLDCRDHSKGQKGWPVSSILAFSRDAGKHRVRRESGINLGAQRGRLRACKGQGLQISLLDHLTGDPRSREVTRPFSPPLENVHR